MMKKTILACVFLQLVLGTVFAQTVDSTHIKNMHAYYKKHFSDPTDPIVLTASDTLLDMAIRCNDTVMSKIALGAKLDYYYYGQGENRTDSVIAGVNRLKRFARSVGNAELYYWAWAARLVNYYIIQGEYNIALLEAEKMLQEAKKEGKQESIAECYYALANVYAAKGLMKKSQEFMLKEIDIFENTDVVRYNISCQYSDAAKIYIDLGEEEKAPELLKKALKAVKSPYHAVTANLVYVSLYLAQGDTVAARQALEKCRQMYADEPSLKRHIHYLYDVEIDYDWKVGNYQKALNVLDERETELKRKNNLATLMQLRKTKADILWDMNRKEEAAGLYRDFLLEQKKEKERNEEVATGEFATMLNLQQLTAEKGRLEKISQEKQLQNTRIILFSVIGILCVVIVFLWQQRKLNAKLEKSRDKLDEKNRILIEAKEELRKAKEVAEQSNWLKTMFIQNMSHEIRTPLNSIVGFSGVLVDMLDDKEDIGQYVALIESNSKLLLKLVGDILDISILDSEVEIKHNAVDVNACCQASIDAAGTLFSPDTKLIFKPACDELIINSNYNYIVQVLDNLLSNASKFTHEGSVTLAYEVKKETNQLIFTVTDTGIGIPIDEQEHVFERFVKLDNFSQGAGLGLSICRIVAERLGGFLIIDREYTQGTRFIFCVSM
ncbi:ATPase/histidine kinase/DNA gyrase B/HSP90 domain protein [Bacteroides intestinalis DSM 17393]|uniref:histidine kinase n=1 Tax=Bacteroides intestinalis DSM 17393 TaxID=471870 RepID=B3C9X1_9BACE|nr:ATP-binding protein [Bacteroides intestinalis]EDV06200.1 ATPase/histidine kinase/DNA gyrase B/HSP90 domain protein [Bacteroides intestinalis DSM 17393]